VRSGRRSLVINGAPLPERTARCERGRGEQERRRDDALRSRQQEHRAGCGAQARRGPRAVHVNNSAEQLQSRGGAAKSRVQT